LTPFRVTEPEDWFYNAHQRDTLSFPAKTETWVWNLHPGAALDALEELVQARLRRHDILMGVVIIPKSLHPELFRRFINIVDLYFFIPAGAIKHGPSTCMKGSQLVSIFLSSEMLPMIGTKYHSWVSLEACCQYCTALTRRGWEYSAPILGSPCLDCHYATTHGARLAIVSDLAPTF
jgi:hypothetical protein